MPSRKKKKTSISLREDVIEKADVLAKAQQRSRSNYLEGLIEELVAVNPITRARSAAGLTIKQMAVATGYAIGVLQSVEEGRTPVSEKMADALKKALPALDVELLLRNDEHPPIRGIEVSTMGTKPDIRLPPGVTARYVPIISWARAGDIGGTFEDDYQFEGQLAFDATDPKAASLEIRGDSMAPRFSAGDMVIVYPSQEAVNGDWVVGKTKDGEQFFKVLTILKQGSYRFSSFNPAYPPFDRKASEMDWLYPVVSVSVKSPQRH